jgi:hypothetical protein
MTDFYGEVMRVSLIRYLRPERKFDSFPELMEAITTDVAAAKDALELKHQHLSFRSHDNIPFQPFMDREGWRRRRR